jgi:hypothetical protein
MKESNSVLSMGALLLRPSRLRKSIIDLEKNVPVEKRVKTLVTEL